MAEIIDQTATNLEALQAQLGDVRFRKEQALDALEYDAVGDLRDQEKTLLGNIALAQAANQ